MILRPDGTPYQVSGTFRQFDPKSSVQDLFNRYDQELIRISGSPIFYYELFFGNIDKQYLECRDKIWSQHPIELMAIYEAIPSEAAMGLFGLDSANDKVIFQLNYKDFLEKVGHPPVVGSRIFTPHKREHWEIINRKTSGYQHYSEIRLEIYAARFQDDVNHGAGRVTQSQPDFEIN